MEILFKSLKFKIDGGRVFLVDFGTRRKGVQNKMPLSSVQLAGGNRTAVSSESLADGSEDLQYVTYEKGENSLKIVERNEKIEVVTYFTSFAKTNAISVRKSIKNISNLAQKIESAASLVLYGVGDGIDGADKTYFYKFVQSHHAECQPRKISLFDFGFFRSYSRNFKRLYFANAGSWSTKEQLPQGIIENAGNGECLMFQIESNHNWCYEVSLSGDEFYLALGGNSSPAHRYVRVLQPNEEYFTADAAFCYANGVSGVINEITAYRRQIAGRCVADEKLPIIFNEYMHLSWDSPSEQKTAKYAKTVAEAGAEYFVMDCGWHDDMEDGVWVYPYMGRWKESKKNFPHGVRATTDYIRSLGMKAGLWIEPEIVGVKCDEMLAYYDDDCFLKRNGERICVSDKYVLNFSNSKVRDYLSESIRRMVEDYGADYVKMDYNVDVGFVDGDFERERLDYLSWVDGLRARFPQVLFETCSSGGMRMDYQTLKHFSIVSTSDQIRDRLYPYIAANVLAGALPEQAAVWSYPVSVAGIGETATPEQVERGVTNEKVALNMVNSMLGRLHLSSDISLLNAEQFALVKSGVEYVKKLNGIKRTAMPYFPLGFTDFSQKNVACGLKNGDKIYLAVWALGGNKEVKIPLHGAKNAKIAYPLCLKTDYSLNDGALCVKFPESDSARFFEIEL